MKAKTKLIIGIVLAVVILAVGLTVTLVVTGNLERDQQQVVRSASQIETAMSTDLGGKTIVLAEDITVEGDLEMSRLADLDLNGHTLTVTGTFSVESDSAGGCLAIAKELQAMLSPYAADIDMTNLNKYIEKS